jgi:hypothetical protein
LVSFVDLLLLARAPCLVASDSGLSEAAWMLGVVFEAAQQREWPQKEPFEVLPMRLVGGL